MTLVNWVRFGANIEDDGRRSLNHFFEPITGKPISVPLLTTYTSPDWALEDRDDISSQDFSYKDARSHFHRALTDTESTDRDKNVGLTFQTLGQVMHHIHDMAQPQHVRNDAHCDEIKCWFVGKYNPSLYEQYTDGKEVRQSLPFAGYAPVYPNADPTAFTTPRKLWDETSKGRGLAQFTNLNFVSAGTNFDKSGAFTSPQFDAAKRTVRKLEELCANRVPACPNPGLTGNIVFYGNDVVDKNTGATVRDPYASSESIFDADLTKAGARPVFSLNRFNFDSAHGFLIPRAVGYSAGLLNYFFRGRLDFKPDPDNPGKYLIKNLSNEQMEGTFALYYDDEDGKRHLTPNKWGAKTLAAMSNASVTLQPNALGDPPPKENGTYMLVFNGAMGQEAAGSATPPTGAVAGKIAVDPALMTLTRVLFSPAFPNQFNPTTRYYLDSNMVTSQDMFDVVSAAASGKKNISFLIDGQPLQRCIYWGAQGLGIYCYNDSYPYTQVTIDITGSDSSSGVPYFDMDEMPDTAKTISLKIEDTVLLQFTFKPKVIQDNSPVNFTDSFHFSAKNATFGKTM